MRLEMLAEYKALCNTDIPLLIKFIHIGRIWTLNLKPTHLK